VFCVCLGSVSRSFPGEVWRDEKKTGQFLLGNIVRPVSTWVNEYRVENMVNLGYEWYQLSKVVGLFVRIDLKDLTNTVVVIPLLEKFFLVSIRVPFNQVLQLRQVGSEQDTATHGLRSRKIVGGYCALTPPNMEMLGSAVILKVIPITLLCKTT
jgi:hypothetical protein